MKKTNFIHLLASIIFLSIACNGNMKQGGSYDNKTRQEIIDEIDQMKLHLPTKIHNTAITMEDVSLDEDIIEYIVSLPQSIFDDSMAFGSDVANSDKNIARMLNSVGKEQVDKFIQAGLGLRYVYRSSDTGEVLMTIEADCDRLKNVMDGVANGDIVAYSALEIFQMEIDKYEFPIEIEDGVWLTDGYIKGNTVYYIANLESDITSDDLSYSDILELKQNILDGLKESLVNVHKKEMSQKGIRIIYVYKNNNGLEFARVEITADDL